MREGACKLLAACSQKDQALEAAKSLLTCNARIMAYMSELQRMKEAQVMQRVARRYDIRFNFTYFKAYYFWINIDQFCVV